jgi:hypothetical protein
MSDSETTLRVRKAGAASLGFLPLKVDVIFKAVLNVCACAGMVVLATRIRRRAMA